MNIDQHLEAILLFKNEPVSVGDLARLLNVEKREAMEAITRLQEFYKDRGIVIVSDGDNVALGTHKDTSGLIENLQKAELSRDLGKAGLETLAIILYKGPVSRREIDYIRGVNSGFILRNLLVRGLIERVESESGERSFSYKPTLELLRHLGLTRKEDLPEFATAFKKLETFAAAQETNDDHA